MSALYSALLRCLFKALCNLGSSIKVPIKLLTSTSLKSICPVVSNKEYFLNNGVNLTSSSSEAFLEMFNIFSSFGYSNFNLYCITSSSISLHLSCFSLKSLLDSKFCNDILHLI